MQNPMLNRRALLFVATCCLFAPPVAVAAAPPKPARKAAPAPKPITDDQIDRAINELVERLYAAQNPQGLWIGAWPKDDSIHGLQYGGNTALVLYALITAGESYQNPKLQRAIEFMQEAKMAGTYAISVRAMLWEHLPPSFQKHLAQDTQWLINAAQPSPHGGRCYTYSNYSKHNYSNSRTKFALLGLWAGAKHDVPVPDTLWTGIETHYINSQNADGGWPYNNEQWNHSRGSMTAAGLVALHVIRDYHDRLLYQQTGKTEAMPIQKSIDKALAWFDKHFVVDHVPEIGGHKGGYSNVFYYLYAMERVGEASGVKYFNHTPWYEAGARFIVDQVGRKRLNPGRDINSKYPGAEAANQITSMAFALLFLSRGRAPVMINKLEIPGYAWNNRPYDMTGLTHWISDEVELPLKWQRIPITMEPVEWADAPLLYLASHEALNLSADQKRKIKRCLDRGGMLITAADANSEAFNKSVSDLAGELYPQYALEPVKTDDPLYTQVYPVHPKMLDAHVLDNGVRHLIVHLPRGDVSWMLHSENMTRPDVWKFFVNMYYYSTEGQPRQRLEEYEAISPGDGGKPMTVVRVRYQGNWNPEPMAWDQQVRFMQGKLDAKIRVVNMAELGHEQAPLAHLGGTDPIQWTEAELDALRQYVNTGGTVLLEDIGGGGRFADSAVNLLAKAFPQHRMQPLASDSAIITGQGLGGFDVSHPNWRDYAIRRLGSLPNPRLMGVYFNDQPRIIVSSDDLSFGMLGAPAWAVIGYSPACARQIMTNIALYACSAASASSGAPDAVNTGEFSPSKLRHTATIEGH